ncbi:MAG: helix-turn-helix domain-containing protein [Blastomonas fulva]|uniref:helix-turn-helix transcriptional regulator n=1 Tax=Blastomonas fulva TaxID=1550728 RepID=UPI0024E1EAF8|nr:DNA-binding protein [Blastomonas fulva]MDK2756433.1 helix-turn-helix domain-containing protein [Blastomonas fulva]
MDSIAVNEQAASALIGVPVSSLQKMRMRGNGPKFAKIGQRVRYRPCDLQDYVAGLVVASTSDAA